MKIKNYIKENVIDNIVSADESKTSVKFILDMVSRRQKILFSAIVLLLSLSMFAIMHNTPKSILISEDRAIMPISSQIAATMTKRGVITVPSGIVKANPFLPYRDIGDNSAVIDVPTYELVEPPEIINENSDAARVMDTIVSGILYDKFSPSAILNIEGNDYLVKKGDVINNYKVINIAQDAVTVKLGTNVYKAGIGEILTEGTLNHNNVPNLNNKFGGEK